MWERITRIFGQQDLKKLNDRILRLEAKEAVLSSFHRYLYSMDTGFKDDILDCYTSDAVLDVPNFPDAGGADARTRAGDGRLLRGRGESSAGAHTVLSP